MAIVAIAVSLGFLGKEGFNLWIALAVLLAGVELHSALSRTLASPHQSGRVIALAEFDSELYG